MREKNDADVIAQAMPQIIERAGKILDNMLESGMATAMRFDDALPIAISSAATEILHREVSVSPIVAMGDDHSAFSIEFVKGRRLN